MGDNAFEKRRKNQEIEGFLEQDGKYAVFTGNKHDFTFIPERYANDAIDKNEKTQAMDL